MRDRPNADELLAIARKVLAEDILPGLASEQRSLGLMLGTALGIVERQCAAGDDPARKELASLCALLNERGEAIGGRAADEALSRLNRSFAAAIRSGRFDQGTARDGAYKHLLATTLDKLAESNPEYPTAK